jgi:hypothetical protein
MPNWCNNTLTIQGPTDTIKPLWDEAQKTGLLNAIKPMPKALEDTTSPTPEKGQAGYKGPQPVIDGFTNWYDWRVANWGCKWDVDTEGLEYVDNGDGTASIAGWFDSPWGPPIEAYNTFCDDFDNCSLESFYEEGGMDFAGHYDNGSDDFIEGISDFARQVIKTGDSGSTLYDFLDNELELTEARREWIEEQMNEDAQKVHDFVVEGRAVNGTMKETQ